MASCQSSCPVPICAAITAWYSCSGPHKCYEPSRDIVIPSFTLKDVSPVDPLSTERPISLLIRFSGARYSQFNDGLRMRLLEYWEVCSAALADGGTAAAHYSKAVQASCADHTALTSGIGKLHEACDLDAEDCRAVLLPHR